MILELLKKKSSSCLQRNGFFFKMYTISPLTTLHLKGLFIIYPPPFFFFGKGVKRYKKIQICRVCSTLASQTFHEHSLNQSQEDFFLLVCFYTEIIHWVFLISLSSFEPYWVTFFKLFSKALRTKGSISTKRQTTCIQIQKTQTSVL